MKRIDQTQDKRGQQRKAAAEMRFLFQPNVKCLTETLCWATLFWFLGTLPAAAQAVHPASEPIVSTRIQHITEMISESPTDLPPYLARPKDVYLLVTAGSAYTEIEVLANPEVPPVSVANALSSSLAGTSLSGRMVEWSADRYSAAKVSADTHHFGARRGTNTISIGALMTGLRRAGLAPHLLLRVPSYSQTSLPPAGYGTKSFRWYDAHHLGGQSSVTVTAALSLLKLCFMLSFFLVVPVIGLIGLGVAVLLTHPHRRMEKEAGRKLFRAVGGYSLAGSVLILFASISLFFSNPINLAVADLWFGSSSLTVLVPFLALGAVFLVPFVIAFHRQEARRFGAAPAAKTSAVPMSDEEKAVRKRAAQWGALPHLVGAAAIGAVPFFINRASPLYPYIHPLAMFLPMLGAGLAGRIVQTRLAKFTQKTLDDDLTWRARQLGMTLGVRMPDVFVEDSSRAAHFAFASHQGHHITLSRKLTATFTPAETDFVLASYLAGMKRHTGSNRRWLRTVLPLLMLIPLLCIIAPRFFFGASPVTTSIFSLWSALPSWSFLAIPIYFVLFLALTFALNGNGTKGQARQEEDTDRAALEATGDLEAALSALTKLEASPSGDSTSTALRAEMTELFGRLPQAGLQPRQAALQQAALTLRSAAARSSSASAEREPPR